MTDNQNITIPKKEEPDLYKRSIKGGYWVISSRFAVQLLGFLKSLFIVNFFLLNDLGIISAAVMMMEILNTFTQTGFESALIQKKGDIHDYLDTAWTAGIVKGVLLFLILFFAAPLLANIRIPEDKVPLAIGVFRAMSLTFLISGFRNIGAIYFSKNLDFHKTFTLSVASSLADIVLSIGLVLIFRSIWGVIAARLVTSCVGCAGTYVLSAYRPKLHFDRRKAKELWTFGKWIFGQNVLGYLLEAGDDYFVWFYLGIQPLALYRTAFRFAITPATHITNVISQVSFPAYSKIRDDLPRLREAYLKVQKVTALFSVPTAFLIFILGPDFVHLFLKEHLHPMTLALQILAVKGLLVSVGSTRGPLFRALGKPQVSLYLHWARLAVLAGTIYPFTKLWGITGTAISTSLIHFFINPLALFISSRMLKCSLWKVLRPSLLPIIASSIMIPLIALLKLLSVIKTDFLSFGVLLAMGVIIYLISLWILDSIVKYGFQDILREQFQLFRIKCFCFSLKDS